ncbi:hypothetical protein WAJ14_19100, partial [Acinetobacter baumannii]
MYADLTENYVNYKAYISDSEFAASLKPNQKVDMYCFNTTANSATQCINYPSSIWAKASEVNLAEIRTNKGMSSFSSILSKAVEENILMESGGNNINLYFFMNTGMNFMN